VLDPLTGTVRLARAFERAGITKVPAPHSKTFATLLRALAKQLPQRDRKSGSDNGYFIGPLHVGKSSRKMPSREVVLTLVLAYLFDRVTKHDGQGLLALCAGDAIESGTAWEVAADFAMAALGRPVDCVAAKKFLRDHRGHLFLRAWPKARQRAA
jgi:hypothetical protein